MKRNTVRQIDKPVKKGEVYELDIDRLGEAAEGVGRIKGFTIFVPGALPHERVSAIITDVRKSFARARLKEIIEPSPDRIEPACPIYAECGGCQLQHLSYDAQLDMKRETVIGAMQHIGKLSVSEGDSSDGVAVLPVIGAEDPWAYRNKMQFPAGRENGKAVIGCFRKGSHHIVDTEKCLIQSSGNNQILKVMHQAISKFRIPVYDEDKHSGILRHVVGREGRDGALMLVLVTYKEYIPREKELVAFLRHRLPKLVSIQQNVQTYHNNVILGRATRVLWGKETMMARLGEFIFHVSARSLFQVNTAQAERLYETALSYAGLMGNETVIDAYCGTGTITLYLARRCREAYGIEVVHPAIADAKKNAKQNNIHNVHFIAGDATIEMPRLYNKGVRPDVIVVDPPRAGCTKKVLETFAAMKPNRIVYVSCNPMTLARDIAIMQGFGYHADKIQPVDMFPQTSHVECCTKLVRADLLEKEKAEKAKKTEE